METYTRQETAQKTGIPDRTIRFWIHEGIMDHPEIKSDGNRRLYSDRQIDELQALKWFQQNYRMTLKNIKCLRSVIIGSTGIRYPLSELMASFVSIAPWHMMLDIKRFVVAVLLGDIVFYRDENGSLIVRGLSRIIRRQM